MVLKERKLMDNRQNYRKLLREARFREIFTLRETHRIRVVLLFLKYAQLADVRRNCEQLLQVGHLHAICLACRGER